MNEREKIIRLWFDMWIKKADLGIDNLPNRKDHQDTKRKRKIH